MVAFQPIGDKKMQSHIGENVPMNQSNVYQQSMKQSNISHQSAKRSNIEQQQNLEQKQSVNKSKNQQSSIEGNSGGFLSFTETSNKKQTNINQKSNHPSMLHESNIPPQQQYPSYHESQMKQSNINVEHIQSNIIPQSIHQNSQMQQSNMNRQSNKLSNINQQSINQASQMKQSNMYQQSTNQSNFPHQSIQQTNIVQTNMYNQSVKKSDIPSQQSIHQTKMQQSNANAIPKQSIYETKILQSNMYNQSLNNTNNNIPNSSSIKNSGQPNYNRQSNQLVPSTHQSKVEQSNPYQQSFPQTKMEEPFPNEYNLMNSAKGIRNDSFPTASNIGKNIAKTSLPQNSNPFSFNNNNSMKNSELPTYEEKIVKSNVQIFK